MSSSSFGWLVLLLLALAAWYWLRTRKQKRLTIEQAEAAPLRAALRLKMDECMNEGRLRAGQSRYFDSAANDPNEPPEDVPKHREKALNFEVQGRGMITLAKTLEVIIGLPTKPEMVAQLERYADEFRKDAIKQNQFDAAISSVVVQGLVGVLADLGRNR